MGGWLPSGGEASTGQPLLPLLSSKYEGGSHLPASGVSAGHAGWVEVTHVISEPEYFLACANPSDSALPATVNPELSC